MSIAPLELPKRAELVANSVLINNLQVTSPDVVAGALRYSEGTGREEVAEYILQAVDVGAKAILLGSTTMDVDAMNTALSNLSANVSSAAGDAADQIRSAVEAATDAESGAVTQAMSRILGDLAEQVTALVAGEDAPVRAGVERVVKAITDKSLEEIQRSLSAQTDSVRTALSSDSPDSPLGAMRHDVLRTVRDSTKDLSEQIGELRTVVEVQKARAATMERTAIKGASYEADVLEVLEGVTHVAGDLLEDTHDTTGEIAKSKAGDGVITLGEAISRERSIRIVVEAKDKTQSVDAWRTELERCCTNRKAVAALGIVKGTEHMPGHGRVKILDRLHILVAFDPEIDDTELLLASLHLLRVQAACVAVEGHGDELDTAAVREHVDTAVRLLDDFDKVDRASNAAQRGLDDIRKHATGLRRDLLDRLTRGLRLIDGVKGAE